MIDPDTLQVEAIIDWEYSGFYPPKVVAPLWTKAPNEPGYHDIDAHKVQSLIKLLENSIGTHQRGSIDHDTDFFADVPSPTPEDLASV